MWDIGTGHDIYWGKVFFYQLGKLTWDSFCHHLVKFMIWFWEDVKHHLWCNSRLCGLQFTEILRVKFCIDIFFLHVAAAWNRTIKAGSPCKWCLQILFNKHLFMRENIILIHATTKLLVLNFCFLWCLLGTHWSVHSTCPCMHKKQYFILMLVRDDAVDHLWAYIF